MRRDEREGALQAEPSPAATPAAAFPSETVRGPRGESLPVFRLRSDRDGAAALAALAATVEAWNGEWNAAGDGGELRVPLEAGLRRGFARGRVTATAVGHGSELAIEVVEARWWVHRIAAALLFGAAVPAVAAVLWPFYPALAPLVPLGLVLGAAAWLAILARLRHRGPAELVADVDAALSAPAPAAADEIDAPPPAIAPR